MGTCMGTPCWRSKRGLYTPSGPNPGVAPLPHTFLFLLQSTLESGTLGAHRSRPLLSRQIPQSSSAPRFASCRRNPAAMSVEMKLGMSLDDLIAKQAKDKKPAAKKPAAAGKGKAQKVRLGGGWR